MSSEQTFSTSDLRSAAQDHKRDAARKHKWALGAVETTGRVACGKPRPHRPHETNFNSKRKDTKAAVAALQHGTKIARKQDMLEGTAVSDDSSTSSSSDHDESTSSPTAASVPADVNVMYSFDASRGPSQGSQILNAALAKAVAKFEERETVKLVRDEYEFLDSEGESVGLSPVKQAKGKAKAKEMPVVVVPDADEDYEFV